VLVLEPHILTTLDSPERVREIVEAATSPFVRVNLDPANFVADLATLWDSSRLMDRMFDALAEVAVSGHVKDVRVEDGFVLHLSEAAPGDGQLDLATFVRLFAQRLPGRTLFLEHLPAEKVPAAKTTLDRLLAKALEP
jgi:sugar phosphate isomerase/epimerase